MIPLNLVLFYYLVYFPFSAMATNGSGKAIYSHSRNPIASFISNKNKHLLNHKRPAYALNSNQVILNSPNSISVQNETSASVHGGSSYSNTVSSGYYGQDYNPVQVIPITNAEEPKPSSSNLVYLTVPSEPAIYANPAQQQSPTSLTTVLNGGPSNYFAATGSNNIPAPVQPATQFLQGNTYVPQPSPPVAPTLLQQASPSSNPVYFGTQQNNNNQNAYNNQQSSISVQDSNVLLSQQNENGNAVISSNPNGGSNLYYNGGSAAVQHQTGALNQQLTSTSQESTYASGAPPTQLQQPSISSGGGGNNVYYATGASGPETAQLNPYTLHSSNDNHDDNFFGQNLITGSETSAAQEPLETSNPGDDIDMAYQTFGDTGPGGEAEPSPEGDVSNDFDYTSVDEEEDLYYTEVPTANDSSTAAPIPDNPLNFLNLVGTDFQPGRLVNIFFGLFIMLFMIITHGYALWILGIAYLPGTRSFGGVGQLDVSKVDQLCSLILDAIEYWEDKV